MRLIKNNGLYQVIKRDLAAYNGKILFHKGEYCGGNDRCYGIFDVNSKEQPIIKVAKGNKSAENWFGILVHEYCHFLQWSEDSKTWQAFEECNFSIDDVIKKPHKHKKELLILIKLEADCEKRVIKLLRKYNISDGKDYAKDANAVLYKYAFLYLEHFWPKHTLKLDGNTACPDKIHRSHLSYLDIPTDIHTAYINSRA